MVVHCPLRWMPLPSIWRCDSPVSRNSAFLERPLTDSKIRKLEICSLLCIIRGLLRHVHGEHWPISQLYSALEEYLLEQCQMPMSSSRSIEKV